MHRLATATLALVLLTACSPEPGGGSEDAGADTATDTTDTADTTVEPACGAEIPEGQRVVERTIGGWRLGYDITTGAWQLTPPEADEPALSAPPSCDRKAGAAPLRLGRGRAGLDSEVGAYDIELEDGSSSIDWRPVPKEAPSLVALDDGGWALRWQLRYVEDRKPADIDLAFRPDDDGRLRVALQATPDDVFELGEVNLDCRADESFFGLGTQVTGMDLRGRTYPLWTQEQGQGKPDDGNVLFPIQNVPEAAYAPMGVWHATGGYSALVETSSYAELDLCDSQEELLRLRTYREMPAVTLVAGDTPADRVEAVTELTGRLPTRPPEWLFGPWLTSVGGPDRLKEVRQTARDRDIPASAIWSEDWIGFQKTGTGMRLSFAWEWDPKTYPDLPQTIDDLHERGFGFLAYFNPFLPDATKMFQEGKHEDYLLTDAEGNLLTFMDPGLRRASMVDLSKQQAVEWLKGYQKRAAEDLGVDGWMADFAEWLPPAAESADGESGWLWHNRYPLLWQQANREALAEAHAGEDDPNDWAYFVRSGWASRSGGTGGIAPAMWGGDQQTDWSTNDGLPSTIPIGTHVGLSGVAIFGTDIGGYSSAATDHRDKELYLRWSAMSAFHPLMRQHHGDEECENWHFDRDDETLRHFRRYAAVHTLLYPYFQRLLDVAMDRGLPILRHPWLVEPDTPELWAEDNRQFFVGGDLLVAPILAEEASSREVTRPSRDWWPLFGDSAAAGTDDEPVTSEIDAPVTEIPVFVRPGTALPLLRRPVDSFYGASAPGVTDLSDVEDAYRIALYPDADGEASLKSDRVADITATGLPRKAAVDWMGATLDTNKLPSCAIAADGTSCVDLDGSMVRLFDVEEATLEVDGISIKIAADGPRELLLGVGSTVWREWAEPTEVTDLDPDVPSFCTD